MPRPKPLPFRSLSWQILLFGCGIVIFTALIIGALNYWQTSRIAKDRAVEKLASDARVTALRINAAYTEMMNDALIVSTTPSIHGIMRSQRNGGIDPADGVTRALLQEWIARSFVALIDARPHYGDIDYIGIADHGRELVHVDRSKDGIEVTNTENLRQKASEAYFQEGVKLKPGQFYFSPVTLDGQAASQPTPTLRLVLPLYDDRQQYFGMIVITANYRQLIRTALTQIDPKYSVYVTDGYGDYIHPSRDGQFSKSRIQPGSDVPPELIDPMRAANQREQKVVQGDRVGYYVPLAVNPSQPNYFVGTLVGVPADDLFAEANRILSENLLAAGLLLAAACILAAAIASRVARPISQVTRAIVAYGEGQSATPGLPIDARGEGGDLARAFLDMTEKLHFAHAAEARLTLQLDAIFENAVDGLIVIDERGIIERVNPACIRLFGYAPDELLGQNVAMLMPEPVALRHDQYLRTYRQTGKRHIIGQIRDEVARRKDGSTFPIALSISEVKFADRRIFTGMIRDVTERKEQDAALRASEEMFRSAMHDAPIGNVLTDPSGAFLDVNKSLSELLGYSSEELKQMNLQAVSHPDDLKAEIDKRQQILAGEIGSYQMEKRYITKSGAIFWALLSVSPARRADGSLRYFISQIQDITARKEMDKLKDQFVSTVSHELRTPLTSILGALGLVIATMAKDLPQRATHLLDIAHENSKRLLCLINDILDMEKVTAGQMEYHAHDEDFGDLARQAIDANEGYAREHHVTLSFTTPEQALPISVDAPRLIQVMSNLMSNAAKFSPAGAQVEISLEQLDGRTRLSVRDHGPGIPKAFRSHIFQRFSQAESSATHMKGGTGLGLYISKLMIEQMGGTIDYHSVEGEGSTFWIELPLRSGDAVETLRTPAERRQIASRG